MEEIRDALLPLVTFVWDTIVTRKVGSAPLNKFIQNLRNSIVPRTGYIDIRNTILNGIRGLEGELPTLLLALGSMQTAIPRI